MLASLFLGMSMSSAGAETEEWTAEQVLADYAARILGLERRIEGAPEDGDLRAEWFQVKNLHRAVQQRNLGAEPNRAASVAYSRSLLDEWIRAQPWNTTPHLTVISLEPDAERRIAALLELCARFPAAADVHQQAISRLRDSGRYEDAERIVERYLLRGREAPDAFRLAFDYYEGQGNGVRAAEILELWAATHPGDSVAWRKRLDKARIRGVGPEGLAELASQAVDAVEPVAASATLCNRVGALPQEGMAAEGIRCYEKLLEAETTPEERQRLLGALSALLGETGRRSEMRAYLTQLPPDQRDRVRLKLASEHAHQDRCREALDLLDRVEGNGQSVGVSLAGLFAGCGGNPTWEAQLLERSGRLDGEGFRSLLGRWWQRTAPSPSLEALALARLGRHPADEGLWRGIDQYYERTEQKGPRLELLISWEQADEMRFSRYGDLIDLLMAEGQVARAVSVLEELTSPDREAENTYWLGRLAELYLATDRLDEAEQVTRRMLKREEQDDGARQGDLLLARIAIARHDHGAAFDLYRRYLARAHDAADEPLLEFAMLAYAMGRPADVQRLLEERYQVLSSRGHRVGTLEEWVGRQLKSLGLAEAALTYLEDVAARSPGRAELHREIAELAGWQGDAARAGEALRSEIDLDPQDPARWYRLAEFELETTGPEQARQTIEEALDQVQAHPASLLLLRARAYMEEGRLLVAIREIRAVLERHPRSRSAEEMLREAYRRLGAQENRE